MSALCQLLVENKDQAFWTRHGASEIESMADKGTCTFA